MARNGGHRKWTIEDSIELYSIGHWSNGYFSVDSEGHLIVQPGGPGAPSADLKELVDEVRQRGIALPLLIRFAEILSARVAELNDAFRRAIAEYGYQVDLSRRLPDQGQPGALRGRGAARSRAPLPLRPRGGLQAGAAGGARHAGRRGRADHLQRLQGRGVHRDRAARLEARPQGHPGRREVHRATAHRRGRRAHRDRAGDRHARPAVRARRRPLGGLGRRPLEVRPGRPRTWSQAVEFLRERGLLDCLAAAPLPPRQPDHRDPQRQGRAARGGADLRRARTSSARRSATSTSAAASASTTTAPRPTSARR